MDSLDIAAFVVMGLLAAIAIAVFVVLAKMPGKIAKQRNHTYAEAVNIAGWLGLFLGGLPWVAALVWAYATPIDHQTEV